MRAPARASCTHVWNYQQALPHLFPALERTLRETEYTYNQLPTWRADLPPEPAARLRLRHHRPLRRRPFRRRSSRRFAIGSFPATPSGSQRYWPKVKRALEYAWSAENLDHWDPEQTGILSGRQHQTLDMELFGPNSWLGSMYVAALQGRARRWRRCGEDRVCRRARAAGQGAAPTTSTTELFNGRWFVQKIDLGDKALIETVRSRQRPPACSPTASWTTYWSDEYGEMKYQIDEGCVTDQILGQWHAEVAGLGQFLDPDKVRDGARARSIANNFRAEPRRPLQPVPRLCLRGRRRPADRHLSRRHPPAGGRRRPIPRKCGPASNICRPRT